MIEKEAIWTWNTTNTQLNIKVPIANDHALMNGTVQIMAKTTEENSNYENLGAPQNIGAINTTKTIIINKGTFNEFIGSGNKKKIYMFNAIISDKFGHYTTGTRGDTQITVDTSIPT